MEIKDKVQNKGIKNPYFAYYMQNKENKNSYFASLQHYKNYDTNIQ